MASSSAPEVDELTDSLLQFDTPNDLKNYLEFFKALRAKIGSDKLISSDTSSGPWVGADGSPSKDLSEVRSDPSLFLLPDAQADSHRPYSSETYSTSSRSWCAVPCPSSSASKADLLALHRPTTP